MTSMKTLSMLLAVLIFVTGCQTALPVKVPGLTAAEDKPRNCYPCAKLVEAAVKKSGHNASVVALPAPRLQPGIGHAICVLEHQGKTFAYDSQFSSMIDLRIPPSQVFDAKGGFIGDAVLIHLRARPIHDFGGVQWGNGLNFDLRGGLF